MTDPAAPSEADMDVIEHVLSVLEEGLSLDADECQACWHGLVALRRFVDERNKR